MIGLRKCFFTVFILLLSVGFTQCNSTNNTMKIASTLAVKKSLTPSVYFQHWVAGVRGGGSGTNLFVNKEIVSDKKLIKAFFKNKIIAFEKTTPESKFYIARFRASSNQLPDYTPGLPVNQVRRQTAVDQWFQRPRRRG